MLNYLKQLYLLHSRLQTPFLKTTEDSRDIYNQYDDREIRAWQKQPKIRYKYIAEITLELPKKGSVLEVGCGNGINLHILQESCPNLDLMGIDIAENRIRIGQTYFKSLNMLVGDITEGLGYPDHYFDLVYSIHCLEQIPYRCRDAVREMVRLGKKVVMIEPVYEYCTPTQRLYLINNDHNRILKRTIDQLGYHVTYQPLPFQSNPLNQSTKIVIHDSM